MGGLMSECSREGFDRLCLTSESVISRLLVLYAGHMISVSSVLKDCVLLWFDGKCTYAVQGCSELIVWKKWEAHFRTNSTTHQLLTYFL